MRIAFGGRNQLLAHPAFVSAEVEHRGGIRDAGVRAARIAVILQPLVEVPLRLGVDLVAEEHVSAFGRVLRVHFLRDLRVGLRLAAAVVAHDDDVLEAGRHRLLGDALEDGAEELRRQADRAGQLRAGVVRRVGQHRHRDRVAEPERDRLDDLAAHQRVAAVDVLRSALLGAAGVDERCRLAGRDRRLHLGPRHHLEFDEVFFRRRFGRLRERRRGRQQEQRNRGEEAAHVYDSFMPRDVSVSEPSIMR